MKTIKNIICLILILSIGTSSAQFSTSQQQLMQQGQEDQQNLENRAITSFVALVVVTTLVLVVVISARKARARADEAKFQACVGKTKSEVYTIYGPPDNIIDDAQGQGGTILIYRTITTSGGGKTGVYTYTYRKMFYLNKDNIVTAVKEDTE